MTSPFTPATILLLLGSIGLSAFAQLLLKLGAARTSLSPDVVASGLSFVRNWHVMGGLACYGLSVLLWIRVLARLDLSLAYPFVSLGFIATMLFGGLFLGETLTVSRVLGTLLIVGGCVVVARSA